MTKPKQSPPIAPLPVVALDTRASTGLDAFAVWHEVCRPAFELTQLQPSRPYETAFQCYNVSGLIFNRAAYGATRYDRTWQHIGLGDADHLTLQLLLHGREHVSVKGGETGVMAPDRIVLRDWAHPFTSESTAAEQISVLIPRHFVEASDITYENHPILSWSLESLQGHLLAHAMTQIWKRLPHMESSETPIIAAGFLGLLNGLLTDELKIKHQSKSTATVTVQAMKTYLLRHLADPELGSERLMEVFDCSRATIYRRFEEIGGVAAFIRDQRLAACWEELSRPEGQQCSIQDLAKSFGFSDSTYFHRAFKKRFGMTPRDAQKAVKAPSVDPRGGGHASEFSPNISLVHTWLNMTQSK